MAFEIRHSLQGMQQAMSGLNPFGILAEKEEVVTIALYCQCSLSLLYSVFIYYAALLKADNLVKLEHFPHVQGHC